MKEFFISNWREITEISLTLCCLIVCLIRRKKINPSISGVASQIPELVAIAESKFGAGNGTQKKSFVMECACKLYKKATGIQLSEDSTIYRMFEDSIESVLLAPQKKKGR